MKEVQQSFVPKGLLKEQNRQAIDSEQPSILQEPVSFFVPVGSIVAHIFYSYTTPRLCVILIMKSLSFCSLFQQNPS